MSIKELERLYPGYTKIRYKCLTGEGGGAGRPRWLITLRYEMATAAHNRAGRDAVTGEDVHIPSSRPTFLKYKPLVDLFACLRNRIPFRSKSLRLEISNNSMYGYLFVNGEYLLTMDLLWGTVDHFAIPNSDRKGIKYALMILRCMGVCSMFRSRSNNSVIVYYVTDDMTMSYTTLQPGENCLLRNKVPYTYCGNQGVSIYILEEFISRVTDRRSDGSTLQQAVAIPTSILSPSDTTHLLNSSPFINVPE